MAEGERPRRRLGGRGSRQPRFIPYPAHELAEYILGAGLIVLGFHSSGRMSYVLEGSGGLWVLLGLLTRARLAIVKVIGRRLHEVLDLLLAAALALSPIEVRHHLDWIAVGVAEAVALIFVRMTLWTVREVPAVAPDGAPPVPLPADSALSPRVGTAARAAGRATGRATEAARSRSGPAAAKGARNLGRAAGTARRLIRDRQDRQENEG